MRQGCSAQPEKDPMRPSKGATRGGAIRLYEPRGGVLGLAEGLETALSMHLLCRHLPVWVAYCADNLARVRLPERLREVQVAVDIDASGKGRRAADALKARIRRWSPCTKVTYILPELPGPGDLNDALRRRSG